MRKNGIVNKYEYVKEKITMDNKEKALLCHKEWNGKLETVAKSKVKTREDLALGNIGPYAAMPVMEGNVYYSKNLEMLTLYRSVWTLRTPKRSFRL